MSILRPSPRVSLALLSATLLSGCAFYGKELCEEGVNCESLNDGGQNAVVGGDGDGASSGEGGGHSGGQTSGGGGPSGSGGDPVSGGGGSSSGGMSSSGGVSSGGSSGGSSSGGASSGGSSSGGSESGGSGGQPDYGALSINEIRHRSGAAIELFKRGSGPLDLTGLELVIDKGAPGATCPLSGTIPSEGFFLLMSGTDTCPMGVPCVDGCGNFVIVGDTEVDLREIDGFSIDFRKYPPGDELPAPGKSYSATADGGEMFDDLAESLGASND